MSKEIKETIDKDTSAQTESTPDQAESASAQTEGTSEQMEDAPIWSEEEGREASEKTLPKRKKTYKKMIGFVCLIVGIAFLAASLICNLTQYFAKEDALLDFYNRQSQSAEMTADADGDGVGDAAADSADTETESDASDADNAPTIAIVRIPKIDSTEPVKDGSSDSILSGALGHMEGTALPGAGGNCVIAGHRNYSFGKFFNRLDEVEIGDTIYVDTLADTYTYQVTEIKVVEPTAVEILNATDSEQLTLFTCTPLYIATHRLVVIAQRVS